MCPAAALESRDVVLIFHGAGGPDRETSDLCARIVASDAAAGLSEPRYVQVFDWTRWRGGQDRAPFDGQAVGSRLGLQLAEAERSAGASRRRTLHCIGTSVGGFTADACVSAYVRASDEARRATARLTLTDPFTARPGEPLGDGWGLRHFGEAADYAEHYLNTDDPVPSTNVPLPLCRVYDVTRAAERRTFKPPSSGNWLADGAAALLLGHNWPMGYLARHYGTELDAGGRIVTPSHDEYPRGSVVRVP